MKSWKLACAYLGVAFGALGAVGAEGSIKEDILSSSAAAALRTYAQSHIAEVLERRAVRQIDPGIIASDARRLASRLDEAQLREIAAGGDVAEIVNEATQVRSAVAPALGSSTSDLVFVPLAPCRIIDTRVAGGRLQPGVVRDFQVAGIFEFQAQGGTMGGCGVPAGSATPNAPAVVINFIAVNPSGAGNLRAWAWGQPIPNASVLNYASVSGLNIANGVVVPIAGTNVVPADLHIQADVSGTDVVADVMGYFTRFTIESFSATEKSITVLSDGGNVDLSPGLCTEVSSCTITAGAPGRVIVRAWTQVKINHITNPGGGGDRIAMGVKDNNPTNCTNGDQSINATDFEVPDSLPADPDVDTTLSHKRIFDQGKGTKTYYINARMVTGADAGDAIQNSRMICTFIPN